MVLVGWALCESIEKNYGSKEEKTCESKEVVCHDGVLVGGRINV